MTDEHDEFPKQVAFGPFDRENAQLKTFPIETCGELVFVNLGKVSQSLQTYLGTIYENVQSSFSGPWTEVYSWEGEFAANWKVPVENAIETYHLACLHPETLGASPKAEAVEHVLQSEYTEFITSTTHHKKRRAMDFANAILGNKPLRKMHLHHRHPNTMFMLGDMYKKIEVVHPMGPRKSRAVFKIFCHSGRSGLTGAVLRALVPFIQWQVKSFALRVRFEDMGVYSSIQRGLEASPFRGVIGTREERIYAFQKYVIERCT